MEFLSIFPLISFLFLAISLIVRIIYLRKKGIKVSSKSGEKPKILLLLYPVFGLLFLVWLAELARVAFQFSWLLLPEFVTKSLLNFQWLRFAGAILIFISLAFWVLTLLDFRFSLRFGLDEKNLGKLITSGIFSRSRNPFFLSIDLFFTGLALFHPSIFFLGMAALTLVSIHFFILKEEIFLRKHYGEVYKKYQEKTGRYF
ncbi:MAG: isoprenylcysteine carboxylmethyltransferase family protein [Mariniphaga sp.]|jgi:protein-S-isoprenylcysteine O-methyltransferase Ste14|nr:isoprenylcysteine carboxylmethyltransferase family protein [Mariniphaga sp.]